MKLYWIVRAHEVVQVRIVNVHRNGRVFVEDALQNPATPFPWPKLRILSEQRFAHALLIANCWEEQAVLDDQLATLKRKKEGLQVVINRASQALDNITVSETRRRDQLVLPAIETKSRRPWPDPGYAGYGDMEGR